MEIINKYISRDYTIKDRFQAGIVLTGPEVKSSKYGQISFKGTYCSFDDASGLFFVKNFYIGPYVPAKREQIGYDPKRSRKLLLTKKELKYLYGVSKISGITILPLRIYIKNRLVKMEIGVAKGLKKHDKREKIKKKDFERRKKRLVNV